MLIIYFEGQRVRCKVRTIETFAGVDGCLDPIGAIIQLLGMIVWSFANATLLYGLICSEVTTLAPGVALRSSYSDHMFAHL